jgi:hypothetical protein
MSYSARKSFDGSSEQRIAQGSFGVARVLVRFNHVASRIIKADYSIM